MDTLGVLVYCAFKYNTQKTEVGIFAAELNASQVYAIRFGTGGSTHKTMVSIAKISDTKNWDRKN